MTEFAELIKALTNLVLERDAAIVPLAQERDRALLALEALRRPVADDPATVARLDALHAEVTASTFGIPEVCSFEPPALRLVDDQTEPADDDIVTFERPGPPDDPELEALLDEVAVAHPEVIVQDPAILDETFAAALIGRVATVPPLRPTFEEIAEVCRKAHADGSTFANALRRAYGWTNTHSQSMIQRTRAAGHDIPRMRTRNAAPVDLAPITTADILPAASESDTPPAPKPAGKKGELVLRCTECDEYEVEVFTPNATGHLSRHTTTRHHRRPTIEEKKPVERAAS